MASLTLYGSNHANATLTTACDMATTTGGAEPSVISTTSGSNKFAESLSIGASEVAVASIPTNPTGKGWVYQPGAGTFATGNWAAVITFVPASWSGSSSTSHLHMRVSRWVSGPTWTIIGDFPDLPLTGGLTKTVYTFTTTSFSSIVFAANDLLHIEVWYFDNSGIASDNPKMFVSNSASLGVTNEMMITTSSFTAGSGVALTGECDGVGTLSGTLSLATSLT